MPRFADQMYTAGSAITPLVLPAASGGTGALTYSLLGLPAGLVFDGATRTISGTPSAATDGAVEIFYTVTDEARVRRLFDLQHHGQSSAELWRFRVRQDRSDGFARFG